LHFRVTREVAGHLLVYVDDGASDAFAHHVHRFFARRRDEITADHDFCAARAETGGANVFRFAGNLQMAPHGAAFLRETRHVERAESIPFQVHRHADDGADGYYAGAANTVDQHAIGFIKRWQHRFRNCGKQGIDIVADRGTVAFLQFAAMDRDEARAKAFHTRIILVATGLIDCALAAEFGFEWRNRDAI